MNQLSEIEVKTILISALQRIARKPWSINYHHLGMRREFINENNLEIQVHITKRIEEFNPLWKPNWAREEYNSCDCSKCIAIRSLHDAQMSLEGEL